MRTSGEHISPETEVPFEGEHISPTEHTEEHISAGRGQGYVCGETHITGEHISAEHISALHRIFQNNYIFYVKLWHTCLLPWRGPESFWHSKLIYPRASRHAKHEFLLCFLVQLIVLIQASFNEFEVSSYARL